MAYKLSNKTEQDLRLIYRYTLLNFGELQANTYLTGFDETFELISSNPTIAQKVDDIRLGYKRYLYHEHVIYFVEKKSHIFIVRVLHQAIKAKLHIG